MLVAEQLVDFIEKHHHHSITTPAAFRLCRTTAPARCDRHEFKRKEITANNRRKREKETREETRESGAAAAGHSNGAAHLRVWRRDSKHRNITVDARALQQASPLARASSLMQSERQRQQRCCRLRHRPCQNETSMQRALSSKHTNAKQCAALTQLSSVLACEGCAWAFRWSDHGPAIASSITT